QPCRATASGLQTRIGSGGAEQHPSGSGEQRISRGTVLPTHPARRLSETERSRPLLSVAWSHVVVTAFSKRPTKGIRRVPLRGIPGPRFPARPPQLPAVPEDHLRAAGRGSEPEPPVRRWLDGDGARPLPGRGGARRPQSTPGTAPVPGDKVDF